MNSFHSKLLVGFFAMLFLAGHLSAQQVDYKPLLLKNAARLGLTTTDVNDAVVTHAYTDPTLHLTYIYLQQAYKQIKVYNTIISATFQNDELLYNSGTFVKDIAAKAGSAQPGKLHTDAVKAAMRHLQLDETAPLSTVADLSLTEKKYIVAAPAIARRDIGVTLFWTPSDDKQQVSLTWNVNIDERRSDDWWNVRINAATGEYVQKDNWTVNENMSSEQINAIPSDDMAKVVAAQGEQKIAFIQKQTPANPILFEPPANVTSATYRVIPYPYESPIHTSFTNVSNPWLLAGANNNATTIGWHFDSTTNYTITRGNNVFAFLDRRANNVADAARNWPDTSSTSAPTLNFIHNINTVQQPFQNTENKKVAIDNLFYWNNIMHDLTYQYGFTEAAGNFQANNMLRGGAGNDFVNANAQDSAGYNNANFSTPTDGTSGRMQMYTFSTEPFFNITAPAPIAGSYASRENNFTAPNKLVDVGPISGLAALYNDDSASTIHNACAATPAANASTLVGKIVLIDATGCTYISKVKKAQNAGAIGAMLYYPSLLGMIGTDATVTIPTISITTSVANSIITQLNANTPVTITLASGIYLDGDLDNGVVCHEYGHGISNRLTGGPNGASCLNNAEEGGEGWSDFFALMMTTNWATAGVNDGANPRPMGTYVEQETTTGSGIRRYPYTTNMNIDPLTYANMAASPEVHNIGEIWCSAIWDMTWNIIQQTNSITTNFYNSSATGGNVIAMNLVMTGLKLQPCQPGFLDARDAILAADSILYNNAHKCAIWNAFARRGMGYSARQGLSTSATDQTAAFDLPGKVQVDKPLPMIVTANAQTTITHTATCDCQAVTGFTIRDTIPAGFTYVSSNPAGTLSGNVLSFPATNFAASEAKNFSIVLKAPATGCSIDSVLNDNRETTSGAAFTSSGIPGWTPSTIKSHSGTSSWFSSNVTTPTSSSLTSANTAATAAQPLSILSFWHNFKTETKFDGGVVEYSTDNGITWTDAGSMFLSNGYNTQMDVSTTLNGRKAFSGNSKVFQPSLLNLSSLGTAPLSLRFRMVNDDGTGVDGWYVDDIVRANGCGGILKTGLYNSSSVRQDTLMMPVFVTQAPPLPLTLLWFYANQVGSQVALDWKTVAEINVKDFTVEWSIDGANWTNLGSVTGLNRSANSYNFAHTMPAKGNNFYRIKMNDRDGRFTYSPVRIINISEKGKAIVLIPNPVNADATLYISKDVKARTLKVYDAAGRVMQKINVDASAQSIKISTGALAEGTYTIEIIGTGNYITRMVVKH